MLASLTLNPFNWFKQDGLLVHLHADSIKIIDVLTGFEVNPIGNAVLEPMLLKSILSDGFNWQNAVEALTAKLALINPEPKTPLRIVLSNDFVRYLLLPAQKVTLSHTEKNAYAKAAFRQLHGVTADSWQIKHDNPAPNQATMLAAIDQRLQQSLEQVAVNYRLKLVSLTPYLMQVFNGLHKQLKDFSGYLALIEGERIVLLNINNGQIEQLKSQFIGSDWQIELNQFLDREQTLGHASSNNVLLCVLNHYAKTLFVKKGWHINHVKQNNHGFAFSPNLHISPKEISA